MKKVLIVGAGVVGLNTALQIQLNHGTSTEITVVDKQTGPAAVSSFANGGQVSVCNAAVWNTWGNVFKGLKWMLKDDAPLRISPTLTPHKISWLRQFVSQIKNETENTEETLRIARASRQMYNDFINSNPFELNSLLRGGIYKVYRTTKSLKNGIDEGIRFSEFGERTIINDYKHGQYEVDSDSFEITNFHELLANIKIGNLSSKIVGGVYYPDDFSFNLYEYCFKVYKFLEERGVKFRFNEYIMRGWDDQFDLIIYCNGVEVNDVAHVHNVDVNVYPVKGYSVTYTLPANVELPVNTSILDEDMKIVCSIFKQEHNTLLRVAGTAELDGFNYSYHENHPRIQLLHNWAVEQGLVDKTQKFMPYSCLRPMTPNMLPFIRRISDKKIIHGGHGHLGQTLSMETARWVSNLI